MALSEDLIACRLKMIKLLIPVVFSILLTSCSAVGEKKAERLPFYNTAEFTAEWISEADTQYQHIHTIKDFSFLNQDGETITGESLKGKIYTANFFFTTCPSVCPKMTTNLSEVQNAFKDDASVNLISFSVTPWKDSVLVLKEYAQQRGLISGKWHLLTGNKKEIYDLARQSYFAEKSLGLQKTEKEFLHTETVLLIDAQARIRAIYNASQKPDMDRLIEDIRILKKEADSR